MPASGESVPSEAMLYDAYLEVRGRNPMTTLIISVALQVVVVGSLYAVGIPQGPPAATELPEMYEQGDDANVVR